MGETDKYKYLKLNLQFLFIEKMQKKSIMTSHRLGTNKLGPYLYKEHLYISKKRTDNPKGKGSKARNMHITERKKKRDEQ